MKTRSLFTGMAIAIVSGMLLAGSVSIVDAQREGRRRSQNRREQWNRGRERIREFTTLERYRRLWFNTSFVLGLEDAILVRAKDVYAKALYDAREDSKDTREIYKTFESQLRRTIGDENFEKLLVSVKPERFSFGRRSIKIGDQGRGRRSRASEKKRESRNRGSDKKYKPRSEDDARKHLGKDKLLRIPN